MTSFGRRQNPVFSDEYKALRRALIETRFASGLSQRELARRLGRAASHISMIETGQRRVDVLEFYLMAGAMGIEPEVLFGQVCRELRGQS